MDVAEKSQKQSDKELPKETNSSSRIDIGALLVEARENKNLSAEDIAGQMNLTLSIITKIESNEFEQDIPLAFIRGYIRSYAQKVGVDVENICVEFDRQTNNANEPLQSIKVVSGYKIKRREINSSSSTFKLITFLIVASILIFASWELYKRFIKASDASSTELNTIQLTTTPSESEIETTAESASPESVDTTQPDSPTRNIVAEKAITKTDSTSGSSQEDVGNRAEGAATEGEVSPPRLPDEASNRGLTRELSEADSNPVSKITGPVASLDFEFFDDCWVKVTDANDEVLAIGIKRKGKVMPLTGITPITVVLGEPSVVSMAFQGEAYDLSQFGAGRRAKFVVQ